MRRTRTRTKTIGERVTFHEDEARQLWREQILGTSVDDFQAFAQVLELLSADGAVVVLGSQQALEAANAERGDWLEISRVL